MGFLVFGKKVLPISGLSSAAFARVDVPFWGFLVSRKKVLPISGLSSAAFARVDVPFWGFLVSGKKVLPISGLSHESLQKCACPFFDHSYFRKIMVVVWQRFCRSGSDPTAWLGFLIQSSSDPDPELLCSSSSESNSSHEL